MCASGSFAPQGWVLDQRGRRIQRGVDGQHRRQLFVIDANQRGGRFRGIFGFGGDRGHRLTEELRLTHREHWPIARTSGRTAARAAAGRPRS